MADETKAPQIENPEKITAKDLAEMVKQMRHNQRRCQRNPTPEKLATLESWERKVECGRCCIDRYTNEIVLIWTKWIISI